jgi:hypothetical protein
VIVLGTYDNPIATCTLGGVPGAVQLGALTLEGGGPIAAGLHDVMRQVAAEHVAPPSVLDEHRTSPGLLLALIGQEAMHRLRAAQPRTTSSRASSRSSDCCTTTADWPRATSFRPWTSPRACSSRCSTRSKPTDSSPRERDRADRRRHLVTLTPAGEKQLASASRAQKDTEDALFASLDNHQREQLRGLLLALSDGLAANPGSDCTAAEGTAR